MYHGATAVYLSTTPAHRNLGSLLTGLKPLPKTQGLCITATPDMDSQDVESMAQYSRVKIQQNTVNVVVDPGKERGILCPNLLLHTELRFEACSEWSCISVVIVDGLHQLATRMLTTSTRMEASLHQHNTSEERRPEINSAAGEAQRSSCSH